jgi:hypothetical protein
MMEGGMVMPSDLAVLRFDDQFEFGWQFDRQIRRLSILCDPIDEISSARKKSGYVRAVGDEATGLDLFAQNELRWETVLQRELRKSLAIAKHDW